MQKYEEAPWWWYAALLVLSFIAGLMLLLPLKPTYPSAVGLIVVIKGQTGLPVWSYIMALACGALIAVCMNSVRFFGISSSNVA